MNNDTITITFETKNHWFKGIAYPASKSRRHAFGFDSGGDATAITTTPFTNSACPSEEWFTLDDHRLIDSVPTTKGIYIHNGAKRVMMKQESGRPDGLEIISNFFETKCDLKERKRKNEKEKFPPAPPNKEKEKKEKVEKTRPSVGDAFSEKSNYNEARKEDIPEESWGQVFE